MRELIRKVLREDINLNSTPSGGSELDSLYGDDKIRWIEEYREHIEKLIPKIIKYFEYKFGDMLENISVVEKDVTYYGGESPRSGTEIVLKFLFILHLAKYATCCDLVLLNLNQTIPRKMCLPLLQVGGWDDAKPITFLDMNISH